MSNFVACFHNTKLLGIKGFFENPSILIYISTPKGVILMLDDLEPIQRHNANENNVKLGIGKCLNAEKIYLFAIFVD